MLNPLALPYWANKLKLQQQQPPKSNLPRSFDDLLQKPYPLAGPTMPAARPKSLTFYAEQDFAMTEELARLSRAVVFDTHGVELGFSVQDVMGFVTRTGQVEAAEISIGILSKGRFLIILPKGMAPETFIQATGPELWDAGFTFQPWSPMDEGGLVLPEYKVLLELHGIPPHLFREKEVAGAMSLFGTFLGSVPARDPANVSSSVVAVAVDKLERVPEEVTMHALGYEFQAKIHTLNWLRAPLYKAADIPKPPPKVPRPVRLAGSRSREEPEPFVVSRRMLLEICKGRDLASLPEEIRDFLAATAGEDSTNAVTSPQHGNTPDPMDQDLQQPLCAAGHSSPMKSAAQEGHTVSETLEIPLSLEENILRNRRSTVADPKGTNVEGSSEGPQKTSATIQLLKRTPANRTSPDPLLIPRAVRETGEASNSCKAATLANGQLPCKDKPNHGEKNKSITRDGTAA